MISLLYNALLLRLSANALVILPPNLSMLGESSTTPLLTISLVCLHKNTKSVELRRQNNSMQLSHTAEKYAIPQDPLTQLKPPLSVAIGHSKAHKKDYSAPRMPPLENM